MSGPANADVQLTQQRRCERCDGFIEAARSRSRYCGACNREMTPHKPLEDDRALAGNWTMERMGAPAWRANRRPDAGCPFCEGTGWVELGRNTIPLVERCRCTR